MGARRFGGASKGASAPHESWSHHVEIFRSRKGLLQIRVELQIDLAEQGEREVLGTASDECSPPNGGLPATCQFRAGR